MEDNKRFHAYGASYSFDRPPPYDGTSTTGQTSSFSQHSMTPQDQSNKASPPYYPQQSSSLIQTSSAIDNVRIHIVDKFGPYPQNALCPHCNQYIITKTKPTSGALTWFACIGLALIGCFLCCCLIPFCCNSCRNVDHSCPNCKRKIGHYTRVC